MKKYLWIIFLLLLIISYCIIEILFYKYNWEHRNSPQACVAIICLSVILVLFFQSLKYNIDKTKKAKWNAIISFQIVFVLMILIGIILLILDFCGIK